MIKPTKKAPPLSYWLIRLIDEFNKLNIMLVLVSIIVSPPLQT